MRTPLQRLEEANCPGTFKPPLPYELELAKKVLNPKEKETKVHALLEKFGKRVDPRREFFRVTIDEVAMVFGLMDGDNCEDCESCVKRDESVDRSEMISSETDAENEPEREYIVEEVLSKKKVNGKVLYEVKWAGYPDSMNSFIPFANFNTTMQKSIRKNHHKIPVFRKYVSSDRGSRKLRASHA